MIGSIRIEFPTKCTQTVSFENHKIEFNTKFSILNILYVNI